MSILYVKIERDIELYNFGAIGVDAVDISSYDTLKADVDGRPTNSVIDSVTLRAGNKIIFPLLSSINDWKKT